MNRSVNRRAVLKLAGGLALATAVPPARADAGRTWCRKDPAFLVDGQMVNVGVAVELAGSEQTSGPIDVVLAVPPGTPAEFLWADDGLGFGYNVAIVEDDALWSSRTAHEVRVELRIPAHRSYDTQVELIADDVIIESAWRPGKTNRWVAVRTRTRRHPGRGRGRRKDG